MTNQQTDAKYEFTAEEKAAMALQVTELEVKATAIEDEKKAAADAFKAQLEPVYEKIQYLSKCVQNGYEMRLYDCRIERDTKRRVRMYRDVMTEKVVKEEPMRPEDYQAEFDGMDK